MKKIFIINGSRNKDGNTTKFIKQVIKEIDTDCEYEWMYPQDYKILPVYESLSSTYDEHISDVIVILKKKILEANLLIVASPVYMHGMSADLKFFIERLVSWSHTFILDGKPSVVLSTCHSNGHDKAIKPISEIITYMGGNVIANSNASYVYDFQNAELIREIALEIGKRIREFLELPLQSNIDMDKKFINSQNIAKKKIEYKKRNDLELDWEDIHWIETNKINYPSFSKYLQERYYES